MKRYADLTTEELVQCCAAPNAAQNREAWEEFVRRFHRLIALVILRTASRLGDGSPATVDDLIQETYLKLCADNFRVFRNFEQHHTDAFAGYVQVLAVNVTRDYFKSRHSQKRGSGQIVKDFEDFIPAAREDDAGGPRAMERGVLLEQIDAHLKVCLQGPDGARNQRIFWLHYSAGLSAGSIAALPDIGITTGGVETVLWRATREVRERIMASRPTAQDPPRGPREELRAAKSL